MSAFDSLFTFTNAAISTIGQKFTVMKNNFVQAVHQIDMENEQPQQAEKQVSSMNEKSNVLEDLEIQQSRTESSDPKKQKSRRIKEIQQEKLKIAEELKKLDEEIDDIKGKSQDNNLFKKRQKIQNDEKARKNAESLVKDLKHQRKEIQEKKRKQYQKQLQSIQKSQQERKKQREEEILRAKEERRLAIVQRMEEEQKRREERKIIDAQSKQLIVKLKKQEKMEKQSTVIPTNIEELERKKKLVPKKNHFDLNQIEEHNRNYNKLKQITNKQHKERAGSMKMQQNAPIKYPKSIWVERLEEEENRKKQEKQLQQERRKKQLETRLKYGELVKNIFMPKKKQRSRQHSSPVHNQKEEVVSEYKPTTPQEVPRLPKLNSEKGKTEEKKLTRDETLPEIKRTKNFIRKRSSKQLNEDEDEFEKMKKLKQQQLRKQTNERLRKLQNQSLDKILQREKPPKYENYLRQVKVKKQNGSEWKKIVDNEKMTEEEKYQELMRKAENMESKAKRKEDSNMKKEADEEAVNLYIGSIQAKLALLEKF